MTYGPGARAYFSDVDQRYAQRVAALARVAYEQRDYAAATFYQQRAAQYARTAMQWLGVEP